MKKPIFLFALLVLGSGSFFTSCDIDEVNDPNNPSLSSVTGDASVAELQVLVTGLEGRNRTYYNNATTMFGSFGREVWAFFASDPRFIDDWLGTGITETYPDFFGSAGTYVSPYLAVKQANVLIEAAQNSSSITTEELRGYTGFAKTIKAYQLMWPLLQQGDKGIRINVEEPLNPGPVLPFDQALTELRSLADEGFNDLMAAEISFSLTDNFPALGDIPTFDGVDLSTSEGLAQFNRAVAAKLAMYDEDWQGVIDALDDSYLDLDVSSIPALNAGPLHTYANAPDVENPLFYQFDAASNTVLIVHPAWVEDAEEGDGRLSKVAERVDNPLTTGTSGSITLDGVYQDARYSGPQDNIAYLRNEELILMYAEAQAQLGNADAAVEAINTIRSIWGLDDYDGMDDTDSLIDQILFERRYSLWGEAGQRWLDLRRYGRLNADNVDLRDGGNLFQDVARRVSEISWDNNN